MGAAPVELQKKGRVCREKPLNPCGEFPHTGWRLGVILDVREVAAGLGDGHFVCDLGRHEVVGGSCCAGLSDGYGGPPSDRSVGRGRVHNEPNGAERGRLLRDDVPRVSPASDAPEHWIGGDKGSVPIDAAPGAAGFAPDAPVEPVVVNVIKELEILLVSCHARYCTNPPVVQSNV